MATRIDKWLWSIRLFKTRSLATEACKNGKVSMNGSHVKPSKEISVNDVIQVKKDLTNLQIKVLQITEKRIGAPLVKNFMIDITPKEELERVENLKNNFEYREKGVGRPTKKNRRELENLKDL